MGVQGYAPPMLLVRAVMRMAPGCQCQPGSMGLYKQESTDRSLCCTRCCAGAPGAGPPPSLQRWEQPPSPQ